MAVLFPPKKLRFRQFRVCGTREPAKSKKRESAGNCTHSLFSPSSNTTTIIIIMRVYKSPVPAPDQSVFEARTFSEKKKTPNSRKLQCPSPPLKTPPVSRIFADQPLITPTAKIIHTPGAFLTTPEHALCIYNNVCVLSKYAYTFNLSLS